MSRLDSSVTQCNLCDRKFSGSDDVYDCKTVLGPWAFLCRACFRVYGNGLGTGKGQRFNFQTKEKLEG